ncbi:MAG: HAMP domain-containing sensor histidine kinase [Gallionella sp.]
MHKTLSALVVHDIKNALALLEIDLEQLNHHADVPQEGQRAYHRCVELKSRLISFLTLYKHEQTGLQVMVSEVDLTDFLEDLISNSQTLMLFEAQQGHSIVVQVNYDKIASERGRTAFFDENLVELALESVLNNAVRYAHHQVDIWFERSANDLMFKVLDDGVGIGGDERGVQRKVAEKSSSTGLGLALCEVVAQLHGAGTVSLESAAGGGTLFIMQLREVS